MRQLRGIVGATYVQNFIDSSFLKGGIPRELETELEREFERKHKKEHEREHKREYLEVMPCRDVFD